MIAEDTVGLVGLESGEIRSFRKHATSVGFMRTCVLSKFKELAEAPLAEKTFWLSSFQTADWGWAVGINSLSVRTLKDDKYSWNSWESQGLVSENFRILGATKEMLAVEDGANLIIAERTDGGLRQIMLSEVKAVVKGVVIGFGKVRDSEDYWFATASQLGLLTKDGSSLKVKKSWGLEIRTDAGSSALSSVVRFSAPVVAVNSDNMPEFPAGFFAMTPQVLLETTCDKGRSSLKIPNVTDAPAPSGETSIKKADIILSPNPAPTALGQPTPTPTSTPAPTPTSTPVPTPVVVAPFSLRINCGAVGSRQINGLNWVADRYFTGGQVYAVADAPIALDGPVEIFRVFRHGTDFSYSIPVPQSGTYEVGLHLAELFSDSEQSRQFKVYNEKVDLFGFLAI